MGRRKIEIQPITHERNRSVTFLKRKNGLFKKAYELGVLCSVDVAVIIFEERPGHHVKLYQYCSGDVDGMVQRHLHFDGERDLKTPADFSSNKNDEAADDDEDAEEDDSARVKKEKPAPQANVKSSSSHASGSTHGNVPIRPAQSTPVDPSRSSLDMNFRGASSSRMGSGSQMNGVPILPVSNERNASASRSGGMSLPSAGISMPLSLPVPPIGQQPQKRQRVDTPLAPPPGITYPYRLNVDLSTYPPAAHAAPLPSQASPQQQRHPQSDLGLPFPSNVGMSMDAFSSSGGFEFPSSRPRPSMGYPGPGQQSAGPFGGPGGMNGVFGSRPGPQTTNMLMDLLNSTAGTASDVSPFEWPATSSQGSAPLDAGTVSNDWLEFLAASTTQQSPHSSALSLGLPTPTTSRAASNSVSSTTSTRAPYGLPSASSSPHCLSPGRKRSRDETCFDDPGSGVLKAMKLGSDGRRSVG